MSPHSDHVLRKATGCLLSAFTALGFLIFAGCIVGLIYGVVVIFGHIFRS